MDTFTVGFAEKDYDETIYARSLASTNGLEYHELKIGNRESADILPRIIWFHDEPLTHANSLQIHMICRYAREYVKVLLTGEGADELFGGYPRYYICKLGSIFLRQNYWVRKSILHALDMVSERRITKLRSSLGRIDKDLVLWNAEFMRWDRYAYLFERDEPDVSCRAQFLEKTWDPSLDALDNLLLFEQKTYLQAILHRQDKMSMGASIESRVPLLDNMMVSLAGSIPARKKINYFQLKRLFKKSAAENIPKKIVYKKKVGFGVPIGMWLMDRNGMGRYLDTLLERAPSLYSINKHRLCKIVEEHTSGTVDHEDILWPLINFTLWDQLFIVERTKV